MSFGVWLCALGLVCFGVRRLLRLRPGHLPFPPGPPAPIPWIKHAFQIPSNHQWLTFSDWHKIYGDVISVKAFGQHIVVLGSLKACTDLCEKRSSVYSDRPDLPMLKELMGWGWLIGFMGYGAEWRTQRRAFHQVLNSRESASYQPIQVREARKLLKRLLVSPERFYHHVRHELGAIIMDVAYGIKIAEDNDPYIELGEAAVSTVVLGGDPTVYFVNTFPWLKYIPSWFPGARFKQDAAKWKLIGQDFKNVPFNHAKDAMKSGTASPSFVSTLLDKFSNAWDTTATDSEKEDIVSSIAAGAYLAGADTTVSSLQTLFLVMANHPDIQKRAQEELDNVVGNERLPDFDDQDKLPYVTAVCKELLRWQPIVPLGLPHAASEDDEYNGYFIPKGSIVIGNIWAILQDPSHYPKPESFNPDRFMKDGQIDPDVLDPALAAFGFGRRICPGRWMSSQALFITVASVLAAYNIAPPLDDNGQPVYLVPNMLSGLVSYPAPFKCVITPRSEAAQRFVQEDAMIVSTSS
ncbi:cytochrome P450 [Punctularia strigosozonata HHB-11173 SS5]|uniref:cytochrome P450 n=1 Tax=Punctularia strigosozonata (strain HHB-11173) TaxID=741275 RepID=UPI0004416A4C|nr:cytochrome P450 [Punctularia strigosozonata HHB-11173 SS5]EIN07330.1 cytochrome P450 [Punctularia strigosozonata HHB-11173 SS5]